MQLGTSFSCGGTDTFRASSIPASTLAPGGSDS
jgi:hypothetical protein